MVSKKRVVVKKEGVWGRRDLYILSKLFRRITPEMRKAVRAAKPKQTYIMDTVDEELKVLRKFTEALYKLQQEVTS